MPPNLPACAQDVPDEAVFGGFLTMGRGSGGDSAKGVVGEGGGSAKTSTTPFQRGSSFIGRRRAVRAHVLLADPLLGTLKEVLRGGSRCEEKRFWPSTTQWCLPPGSSSPGARTGASVFASSGLHRGGEVAAREGELTRRRPSASLGLGNAVEVAAESDLRSAGLSVSLPGIPLPGRHSSPELRFWQDGRWGRLPASPRLLERTP
jgi:hypothetical protein